MHQIMNWGQAMFSIGNKNSRYLIKAPGRRSSAIVSEVSDLAKWRETGGSYSNMTCQLLGGSTGHTSLRCTFFCYLRKSTLHLFVWAGLVSRNLPQSLRQCLQLWLFNLTPAHQARDDMILHQKGFCSCTAFVSCLCKCFLQFPAHNSTFSYPDHPSSGPWAAMLKPCGLFTWLDQSRHQNQAGTKPSSIP